jgi:KaiC/GvpD/RAD55 family RecA-like ATPase
VYGYEETIELAVTRRGLTLLLGGLDTGKTIMAQRIAALGIDAD